MSEPMRITSGMSVDEIMCRWPATIDVFILRKMLCVGCPIGPFHTLKDACQEYQLDEAGFLAELTAAINAEGD